MLGNLFERNCHKSLGPAEIKKLSKIYREPAWQAGKTQQKDQQTQRSMRIVRLVDYDPPEEINQASEKAEKSAQKKIKNTDTHTLYEFHWRHDHTFSERELILPINKDADGKVFVCAPGTIVSVTQWKRESKSKAIVFLEIPRHRRIRLSELARRVGRTGGRKLKDGRVIHDQSLIDLVLDMFSPPVIK